MLRGLRLSLFASCLALLWLSGASIPAADRPSTKPLRCREQLRGTFEFRYTDIGTSLVIMTATHEYYFRRFPDLYYVNQITWLGECTCRIRTARLHDPQIQADQIGDEWTSTFTKIEGRRFYFRNFQKGKLLNEGYIAKISDNVPLQFQQEP